MCKLEKNTKQVLEKHYDWFIQHLAVELFLNVEGGEK
jgi:hypothetical protein